MWTFSCQGGCCWDQWCLGITGSCWEYEMSLGPVGSLQVWLHLFLWWITPGPHRRRLQACDGCVADLLELRHLCVCVCQRCPLPDYFFMSVGDSKDIDNETAVKRWYNVKMTTHRLFSSLFLLETVWCGQNGRDPEWWGTGGAMLLKKKARGCTLCGSGVRLILNYGTRSSYIAFC